MDLKRANGYAEIYVDGKLKSQAELVFVVLGDSDLPENKHFYKREEYISNLTQNTLITGNEQ